VAEQTTQTASPETPKPAVQAAPETKPDDIVSRASGVKLDAKDGTKPDEAKNPTKELNAYLASVTDPQARKLVEDAYKSMQADYTRKTQDLASERKQMESLKAQLEQSSRYTPERIQQLLNDPSFVQAAQQYQAQFAKTTQPANGSGDLSEEELSYLPPEQQKLYHQQKQMQTALANLQGELQQQKAQKEDLSLQSRYKNYDPKAVDQIFQDMMTGKVQATREHLWKVHDYDDAVKRAYELGRQDAKGITQERVNGSTMTNGMNAAATQTEAPSKIKGESFHDYWKRLAAQAKNSLGKP
jgi:peptidoglycan hydrolase-like protein with peptidoglycan-binding domain